MSVTERSSPRQQARDDAHQPEFVVRAKTGPGRKEWATIGYAWRRERGELRRVCAGGLRWLERDDRVDGHDGCDGRESGERVEHG